MNVRPGDQISWQSSPYRVVAVRSAYVTLRPLDGGEDVDALRADLERDSEPAMTPPPGRILDLRILDNLEPAQRKVLDVWLDELERLEAALAAGASRETAYGEVAARVNRRLGTDYRPGKVFRQRQSLERHGPAGLLDRRQFGLADRPATFGDPRLIEAILSVKAAQTRAATGTKTRAMWLVRRELEERFGEGTVPLPSRATFYRLFDALEDGAHTFGSARTRRTTANQPSHMHGTRSGLRPGEQVLIDSTPMEIYVECDGEPIRPDLTILLDEASRSVLAAVVTIGTRSIDLAVVLARALVPYAFRPEGVRQNRRLVARAWVGEDDALADDFERMRVAQPYVFPESITTDRGQSYLSRHFSDACRTLRISLTVNAEYSPTQKAKVERMFGTIKEQFTQYAIGFLGESPDNRGDELISTDELLTLEQLQELLEDWLAVTWQNQPHSSLRDPQNSRLKLSPNQMIKAYREIAPELHVPLTADQYIALLPTAWRVINNYGVDYELRRYDSERLNGLRKRRSPHTRQRGKWPIHIDPYNPMTVWLEVNGSFIPLEWRSPYNGAPMVDEIWRVARAQATARGEAEPAYHHLNEAMRRFMNAGNKPPTAREEKRRRATARDPLALTNTIAAAAPGDLYARKLSSVNADHPPEVAREWPDLGSLGFTRPAEES